MFEWLWIGLLPFIVGADNPLGPSFFHIKVLSIVWKNAADFEADSSETSRPADVQGHLYRHAYSQNI